MKESNFAKLVQKQVTSCFDIIRQQSAGSNAATPKKTKAKP